MDVLGYVFFIVLVIILIFSNFYFLKELKKNAENRKFKYKFIGFLISVVSCITITVTYFSFLFYFLEDILKLEIENSDFHRLTMIFIIATSNGIANFLLLKLYLRRINKINEIELIGTE